MEVDLDSWSIIGQETGGRDERKLWVAQTPGATRTDHWLWKPRRKTGGSDEDSLTDVAEVVTSQVAATLGLPAARCELATRADSPGVISKNVAPRGFDLHEGRVYLAEVDGYRRKPLEVDAEGRHVGHLRRDEGYSLDTIAAVIDEVDPPPGVRGMTAGQVFAGYLVLDALVANTDRHPGNWALLQPADGGQRLLAPTYDHGTALGSGLTEHNRATRDVASFCAGGRANPFSPSKPKLGELADAAVKRWDAPVWIERVGNLRVEQLDAAISSCSERLSEVAARFIKDVLTINQRRLCDEDIRAH